MEFISFICVCSQNWQQVKNKFCWLNLTYTRLATFIFGNPSTSRLKRFWKQRELEAGQFLKKPQGGSIYQCGKRTNYTEEDRSISCPVWWSIVDMLGSVFVSLFLSPKIHCHVLKGRGLTCRRGFRSSSERGTRLQSGSVKKVFNTVCP